MGIDMSSARMLVPKVCIDGFGLDDSTTNQGESSIGILVLKSLCGVEPSPHASAKLRRAFEGQINHVRELC